MDLWDVVKLMVRRWYASVPMMLLTMAAVVWTAVSVNPNFTAEGNIMMLPPVTEVSPETGQERAVNPWTTESLAGAVVTRLRNRGLAQQLEAEGYSATWEAGPDLQFWSVINIIVTSPTEAEAQRAVQRLLQVVEEEVGTRQAAYNLRDGEKVGTIRLSAGENVDVARGNQMRALIVVLGAGGIFTIGLTIAVDALVRWRNRRALPPAARVWAVEPVSGGGAGNGGPHPPTNGAHAPPAIPVVADGHEEATLPAGIRVRYRAGSTASASVPPVEPVDEPTQVSVPPVPLPPGHAAVAPQPAGQPSPALSLPTVKSAPPRNPGIPLQSSGPSRNGEQPDDSTIVLPLSNLSWERDNGGGGDKPGKARRR